MTRFPLVLMLLAASPSGASAMRINKHTAKAAKDAAQDQRAEELQEVNASSDTLRYDIAVVKLYQDSKEMGKSYVQVSEEATVAEFQAALLEDVKKDRRIARKNHVIRLQDLRGLKSKHSFATLPVGPDTRLEDIPERLEDIPQKKLRDVCATLGDPERCTIVWHCSTCEPPAVDVILDVEVDWLYADGTKMGESQWVFDALSSTVGDFEATLFHAYYSDERPSLTTVIDRIELQDLYADRLQFNFATGRVPPSPTGVNMRMRQLHAPRAKLPPKFQSQVESRLLAKVCAEASLEARCKILWLCSTCKPKKKQAVRVVLEVDVDWLYADGTEMGGTTLTLDATSATVESFQAALLEDVKDDTSLGKGLKEMVQDIKLEELYGKGRSFNFAAMEVWPGAQLWEVCKEFGKIPCEIVWRCATCVK